MADWEVIVVGAGGAGLAAAIEAAVAGARVLVLEKHEKIGGSTSWSVGSLTSSGTRHQEKLGIADTSQAHFEDMDLLNKGKGDTDNLVLRRILCDQVPDTVRWLERLGVTFIGPHSEPPHRVPRMHNVVPSSASFPFHLARECTRLGVEIRCGSRVTDLVFESGRVTGVKVEGEKGDQIFSAERGVILAAGDYSADSALKSRYFRPEAVHAAPVNQQSTGDGIKIAERYGAQVINGGLTNAPRLRFVPAAPNWLHRVPPYRWVGRVIQLSLKWLPERLMRPFIMQFLTTALAPEPTLFKCGAILVDCAGDRLDDGIKNPAHVLALTPQNLGYLVFSESCARQLEQWPNFISTAPGVAYAYLRDYRVSRKDIYFEATSIEDLAVRIGIDSVRLRESIEGAELEHQSQSSQSFYALGPVRAYIVMTEGGVSVNERLEVLGEFGTVIQGLYAAGSTGQGGLMLEGHGHHIGWAFVSGRLAGRNAMASR